MNTKTSGVQIVLPQHCNGYKKPRLFGGQIMAWIDVVGAVAARRYTNSAVTTACVENLSFLSPAYLNDTVVQEAVVTWTGRTSLEVRVDTYVERLDGTVQELGPQDSAQLHPGDVFVVETPGGGGYGAV